MKLWGVILLITTVVTLSKCASTKPKHEPQVHEELDEEAPKYVRTARHLGKEERLYRPPSFNYKKTAQQDRMKSRYHRQQQADIRNLRILPLDHDTSVNQEKFVDPKKDSPMLTSSVDNDDWKPFQPSFLKVQDQKPNNDLDAAGTQAKETTIETDRSYIYVSPDTLSKDFGLDAKTTEHILQTSSPMATGDKFQVQELQDLLGKNPEFQLQGLQKLLDDAHPLMATHNEPDIISVDHNGSPSQPATGPQYQTIQEQITAFNKAQEEKFLTAAQQQADTHVQAQREAIALAQKRAQEEAYAKIAAHNQGVSTLSPESVEIFNGGHHVSALPHHVTLAPPVEEIDQNSLEPEVSALQARPVERVLGYPGSYGSPAEDLRNVKPKRVHGGRGRFLHVSEKPVIEYYHSTAAPSYLQSTFSPVWSSTVATSEIHPSPTPKHKSYHGVRFQPKHEVKQLYVENVNKEHSDQHQYAANYAFGYRIRDEKHGNDFGHEEERKGKNTKGHYYVTLPDGRKQKVDYFADNSGYHARVSYENVGQHPHVPVEGHHHQQQLIHHKK